MADDIRPYELLKTILQLSNAPLSLESKLDRMLQAIAQTLQSDRCLLLKPEGIQSAGMLSRIVSEKTPFWVENASSLPRENILPEEEHLILPSFACLPLDDEASCQGILYVGFQRMRRFSLEERNLLHLISMIMAGTNRKASLLPMPEQTRFELTALRELGKVVTSTLKLEDLLQLILVTGSRILKAQGGVLRLMDRNTGELKVKCRLGNYDHIPFDAKIARRVLLTKKPYFLQPSGKDLPFVSVVYAPLISQGKSFGTLSFYDLEANPSTFSEEISQLLLTTVNQISSSIDNALSHYEISDLARRQEIRARRLSTLWDLNKALLTTVNLDRMIELTLMAITIGDGLGFNRAMLFLLNEGNQTLYGTMAIGPDSAEEAGRIWNSLSASRGSPFETILALQPTSEGNSLLNSAIKRMRIPLSQNQCILSRSILEGKSFNIQLPAFEEKVPESACGRGCQLGSGVGCQVAQQLGRDPKVYAFATVPLWGKGKIIGVILVDNLYNNNPITDEDVHFLSMFANQAGLAIENAILYRNIEEVNKELKEAQALLVHREKMAALGELSNTIAHEIRNPLVSIGGFARRLYRTLPLEMPENKYSQTIMVEVGRLERILNNILQYTRDDAIVHGACDLREILDDGLSMLAEEMDDGRIVIARSFDEQLPRVMGDRQGLKQAFFNLLTNACQAMQEHGTLSIRAYPFSRNGSSFVRVEVKDTGKGIAPENLHNIFNPFFSTRESGLGLGLPIVHKIVTSHGGQIEIDNHPGEGTAFIVTLPTHQGREQQSGLHPKAGQERFVSEGNR